MGDVDDKMERLQHLASMGEMAAGITHETRNALTSILGFAQLARERGEGAAMAHVANIEREAQRAVGLLENFLQLSRPRDEHGRGATDVSSVVADVISAATAQARMQRTTLTVRLAADLPRVHIDRGELVQVVLNLITNALHATPEQGEIMTTARVEMGAVEIAVSDDGAGVPHTMRERIFEPFVTTKASGTGLGLAVCRRIIEAAGGTIACTDGAQRGARFVVRLPVRGEA